MSRERWMALFFALGSACFLLGPFPGYAQLVGASADAVTFFVGSVLFTAGGALQTLIAFPERHSPHAGPAAWWAATIQSAGTLFFNVTTYQALHTSLSNSNYDRLVWRPDAFGSICFLVASELAYAEAGHAWFSWRPRSMGWRIAAVNLLGSVFFGISAIAGWVQPSTGNLLDAALDTSGTFLGAICFLIGAALLLVPDPGAAPNEAGAVSVATG